ncbi:MAG: hypothetical protein J7K13_04005 [Thermoplasmata archaeon]|nr:hypothetical protein [Thermoplasmata archaeon]
MEEVLYNIEIHRDGDIYLGRIYSDVDGMKEFKNHRIEALLRDITLDIQLALDEFANRITEFAEGEGIEEIE